ncbi:MAG: HEAT repeat domain-containing protein [Nitrospirota bacterium]
MKRQRQEMKKGILSISYLLIALMIAALTACGGLKGPMIPKSNIPADIDVVVKMEIERLYSSSSSKRENGAHNLGIIGKEAAPAAPFLIDMLKDKNEDVRVNVAIALGKIGDPRAVEPLIIVLKDEDEDVRFSSALALGNIKDPRAVEPLIVALNKKEEEVLRRSAAEALGNIKDLSAVEPLIAILKGEPLIATLKDDDDGDVYVRKSAKEALEKISGNNLGYDHAKWQAWWAENKNKQLASPRQ